MRIHFFAPSSLEPWDHRSLNCGGIGGTETAITELSSRLGLRGHRVTVYCPTKVDTSNRGSVVWRHFRAADFKAAGLWIICNAPVALQCFHGRNDQTIWHRCDNLHYEAKDQPPALTPELAKGCEKFIAMSPIHRQALLAYYPFLTPEQVVVSEPGIPTERIASLPPRERDPYRLIWSSSPDRGLLNCIRIFQRAREFEPRLNLHVAYDWNNIDATIKQIPNHPHVRLKAAIAAQDQANIVWRGRLGKQELYEAYQEASYWMYPTSFFETACCAAMEAQALGCIPITQPYGALAHNVRHGAMVLGDPSRPLVQAHYWRMLLGMISDPESTERMREEMMARALEDFTWERGVDSHEELMGVTEPRKEAVA